MKVNITRNVYTTSKAPYGQPTNGLEGSVFDQLKGIRASVHATVRQLPIGLGKALR